MIHENSHTAAMTSDSSEGQPALLYTDASTAAWSGHA
jgi:hypothetical protein